MEAIVLEQEDAAAEIVEAAVGPLVLVSPRLPFLVLLLLLLLLLLLVESSSSTITFGRSGGPEFVEASSIGVPFVPLRRRPLPYFRVLDCVEVNAPGNLTVLPPEWWEFG